MRMQATISRRSINIEGQVTSLALEPAFWEEIDERAARSGATWAEYTRQLLDRLGPRHNRASALKQYLMQCARSENGYDSGPVFRVHVFGPGERGEEKLFRGRTLLIGRASTAGLRLADEQVSRAHAYIFRAGGRWWAADLESKNGTWLGDKRVAITKLNEGVRIRIGQYEIEIE